MTASGPLAGIRALEVATWIMTPAAAGVLATFGADVIKVEPAGSADPMRRLNATAATLDTGFELANNRKRAIQLDLGKAAAQEVIQRILAGSDIFLTNVRADSLRRAGLDPETLVARYPRLIVAHGTGYGRFGPTANRPA
ncbi:MAG: CoA transferase, partial [Dehalococcoidia bacterium]